MTMPALRRGHAVKALRIIGGLKVRELEDTRAALNGLAKKTPLRERGHRISSGENTEAGSWRVVAEG